MTGLGGQGAFCDDRQSVELSECLGVELDMSMMGFEVCLENFPPFDGFAVPPLLAKGLGYGLKLERRR